MENDISNRQECLQRKGVRKGPGMPSAGVGISGVGRR